ncbi:MAG: sensor histidine kinase [Chloroflexota bacterium]|nr:sensor histidine kinase [Chloroflexota bacterium]MDE3192087.1 sensor histidine kinase [Chloroflexota bacterium]
MGSLANDMGALRLRWIAVVVPVIAVGILDLVTDHEWSDIVNEPLNTLAVPVIVLLGAILMADVAFGRIDRLTSALRERNAALEQRERENERLQRQLRELAVRSERERIAREMHDGLVQVLGYVNTKAQAVEELLAVERPDEARRQLGELAAAARSVYVDTRAAILGLADPVSLDQGVASALEEYARRFADSSKLAVTIDASAAARSTRLAPDIEAHVFRIAQEALTNVRKHATARRAAVRLEVDDRQLTLAVEDDGSGFDSASTPAPDWPHYGMRAIRERAAAIEGSAEWSSRPGAGTLFRLRLPLGAARSAAV